MEENKYAARVEHWLTQSWSQMCILLQWQTFCFSVSHSLPYVKLTACFRRSESSHLSKCSFSRAVGIHRHDEGNVYDLWSHCFLQYIVLNMAYPLYRPVTSPYKRAAITLLPNEVYVWMQCAVTNNGNVL